ncbi:hypothetical protein bthur0013_18500 [Bacillus thuringiensis IBL 200]|nr:hypothetical protein bthur0013_18500 [Bacillus thuringiensis IBL 200]
MFCHFLALILLSLYYASDKKAREKVKNISLEYCINNDK